MLKQGGELLSTERLEQLQAGEEKDTIHELF
jgi:hypothetical protein